MSDPSAPLPRSDPGRPRRAINRRSGLWRVQVVSGFQRRFVLTNVLWLAVALLVLSASVFLPLTLELRRLSPAAATQAADRFLMLHTWLWPGVALVLAIATVQLLITTHRVAGPLVRLRRVLAEVRDLDFRQVVRLRDGDYLGEEAAALNDSLASLRAFHGEAQRLSDEVERLARALADGTPPPGPGDASAARRLASVASDLRRHLGRVRVATRSAQATPTLEPVPRRPAAGFTLVEMLIVTGLIGVVAAMALPQYQAALEAARVARATGDIKAIEREVLVHRVLNGSLPAHLADIGRDTLMDPWGNAYAYLPLTAGKNPKGARKDRNLHPLNSDFDLYSKGRDGKSQAPITAKSSQDDVIRAADGGFVGLASAF